MAPKTSLNVRIDGLAVLEGIPGGIDRAQKAYLEGAGRRLSRQIGDRAPRRTGRLARSWQHRVLNESQVEVKSAHPGAKAQDVGAFIQAKRGAFLRFRAEGRVVFVRFVRLKGTGYTAKGLRGRARIVKEEFARAMDRITAVSGPVG